MANAINQPLPGYPQPWGTKNKNCIDHYGPVSYANIGTSSGAGDVVKASDLGQGGIETIHLAFQSYSNSGNFLIKIWTGTSTTNPTLSFPPGAPFASFVIQWFNSATFGAISTEVANGTNLNAEYVRLDLTMV